MDSFNKDLEVPKELKEIDMYVLHIVPRFRNGSVKYDIIERRGRSLYNRSVKYMKSLILAIIRL